MMKPLISTMLYFYIYSRFIFSLSLYIYIFVGFKCSSCIFIDISISIGSIFSLLLYMRYFSLSFPTGYC